MEYTIPFIEIISFPIMITVANITEIMNLHIIIYIKKKKILTAT